MYIYASIHVRTCTHTHQHTHTNTHTHTHAHAHAHAHIYRQTYTQKHRYRQSYTCMHACIHHTDTHTDGPTYRQNFHGCDLYNLNPFFTQNLKKKTHCAVLIQMGGLELNKLNFDEFWKMNCLSKWMFGYWKQVARYAGCQCWLGCNFAHDLFSFLQIDS